MFLREWVAIFVVLGFLGSLTLIEKYSRVSSRKIVAREHEAATRLLTIHLTGAVKKPGIYKCEPGSSLKNLLDSVGLIASANRKKISFKKILFTSQKIEIPEKKRVEKNFSLEEN